MTALPQVNWRANAAPSSSVTAEIRLRKPYSYSPRLPADKSSRKKRAHDQQACRQRCQNPQIGYRRLLTNVPSINKTGNASNAP